MLFCVGIAWCLIKWKFKVRSPTGNGLQGIQVIEISQDGISEKQPDLGSRREDISNSSNNWVCAMRSIISLTTSTSTTCTYTFKCLSIIPSECLGLLILNFPRNASKWLCLPCTAFLERLNLNARRSQPGWLIIRNHFGGVCQTLIANQPHLYQDLW